ncbi:MAG: response regulator [Acidimicrobiales bacterium]
MRCRNSCCAKFRNRRHRDPQRRSRDHPRPGRRRPRGLERSDSRPWRRARVGGHPGRRLQSFPTTHRACRTWWTWLAGWSSEAGPRVARAWSLPTGDPGDWWPTTSWSPTAIRRSPESSARPSNEPASVDHVTDGQVLLDRLQDPLVRLPKVVLLEFDLLAIDGLTILRRLQKQAALRRFDVVMLSARTRENDIREAYDLGAVDVIQKPFSPGILVRRLLRIMDADG